MPDAVPAGPVTVAATQLERLAHIAAELGDLALASDARAEHDRLVEARFFVACLGQFKRGKSTLLNALVGQSILPVGVVPVTSVVTICGRSNPRRTPCTVMRPNGSSGSRTSTCREWPPTP